MNLELGKIYNMDCLVGMDLMIEQGITVDACKNTNRNFIGFELDKNYFAIANKRLEAVQGSLF